MPFAKMRQESSAIRSNSAAWSKMSGADRMTPVGFSRASLGTENASITKKLELENGEGSKLIQMAKMISVILVPILTLFILTGISLGNSVQLRKEAIDAQDKVISFFKIDFIVTDFQVERGTTATYLSSGGKNRDAFERLLVLRTKTDSDLENLSYWPEGGLFVPGLSTILPSLGDMDSFPTKEIFKDYLTRYRDLVKTSDVTVETNIQFYTKIDKALITWGEQTIVLPESGNMWPKVVAASALLRGSDALGIVRALGSTFYTFCGYTPENNAWFLSLEGETATYFNLAFKYDRDARDQHSLEHVGSNNEKNIALGRTHMRNPEYRNICLSLADGERYINSFVWFDNLTTYMKVMSGIRNTIRTKVLTDLDSVMEFTQMQVIVYSLVMVIVTISSIGISVWYTLRIYKLTDKVMATAKKMSAKNHQLQAEKRKTDILLYQMIPPVIAIQLKAQREVAAEYFDGVSIYFSDIVGFTKISAKSTPFQVIDLLNNLYSTFDASIDRYDVYKVETIGDAYMVAAGVPERNVNHAAEMADLSLELLQSTHDFIIPHIPDQPLQLRIGVHSGACVAGVVGLKMPRYCLFGNTVILAAQMEATSEPQKIHISDATQKELGRIGGYVVQSRGQNNINGMGMVETHWLLGKTFGASPLPLKEEKRLQFDLQDM